MKETIFTSPVTPIVIIVVACAAIIGVLITAGARGKKLREEHEREKERLEAKIRQARSEGRLQGIKEVREEARRQSLLKKLPKDRGGYQLEKEPDVKSRANRTGFPKVLPGKTFRERAEGIRRGSSSTTSGSTSSSSRGYYEEPHNQFGGVLGGVFLGDMISGPADDNSRNDSYSPPAPDPTPSSSSSYDSGSSSSSYDSGSSSSYDSGSSFSGGDSGSF